MVLHTSSKIDFLSNNWILGNFLRRYFEVKIRIFEQKLDFCRSVLCWYIKNGWILTIALLSCFCFFKRNRHLFLTFFCGWDLCVRYGYLLLSNSRKSENSQLKSFAASKKYSFQIMKKSGEISYEVVRGYCTYQYVIRIIMYHNNFLIRFKILRCDGSTLIKARMSTSAGIAKLQGLDTCHED